MAVETAVKSEGEMRSSVEDLSPTSGVGGGGDGGCGDGGGGGDGKDDYVFVNGSIATSDDHGEVESNADVVKGGGDGDKEGMCNGHSVNEVVDDNVVVVNGGEELKVVEESNGAQLAKVVENGDRIVNDRDFEAVEGGDKGDEGEVKADEDSIVNEGDECNGIASSSVDDDDNGKSNDNGCDSVGNGSDGVEIEPPVYPPCGEIEDQINEPEKVEDEVPKSEVIDDNVNRHVDEGRKSEVIEDNVNDHTDEVKTSDVVEDTVNPDVDEGLVTKSEAKDDGVAKETQPVEAEVVDQSQENGDHVDAIVEEQSIDGQQQDLRVSDNGELGPVESEAEVREQGDVDPSQDLESVVSEATVSVEEQDALEVRPEPEEYPEPQDIVEQSEVAVNESNGTSTASELDGAALESTDQCVETTSESMPEVVGNLDASTLEQSDKPDKPADDHESDMVNGEGSEEAIVQVERNLECSVQETVPPDQVVEDTGLVDVTDREVSSEDVISSNEVGTVDDTPNPSKLNWADDVVDEDIKDLDACDLEDSVPGNDVTVPESSHDSSNSQVDNGSYAVEPSSLANLKSHNDGIQCSIELQTEVKPVSDDILDITDKACFSEGTLRFGSFLCQTKSSGLCTSLADVNAQIITDGVPASSLEESGVSATLSDVDAQNVTDEVSASTVEESVADSADRAANLSDADAQIVTDGVSASPSDESATDSTDGTRSLSGADAQIVTDGVSASLLEESKAGSADGETVEPVRNPFRWLIRVPRLDNAEYEQINKLQTELANKTKDRDAFWKVHQGRMDAFREAKAKLHAARDEKEANAKLMMAKKREIDSAQSVLKLARDGNTVERIDAQILNMERRIQHETMNLTEEKRLIREIKQLSQQRERLAADTQGQQEVHQAVDRKVETEEQLKALRKEMDVLGGNYRTALETLKAAERKFEEESKLKHKLEAEYNALATTREETYNHLRTLKKQAYEKNKPCYEYRDAKTAILNLKAGEEENLERLCVNQVENFMELWNKNDKFRKEYIKSNMRSTLRRFNTLDGRDLGIDEKKPLLEDSSDNGATSAKVNSVAKALTSEREFPLIVKKEKVEASTKKVTEMKSTNAPAKNSGGTTSNNDIAEPSKRIETEDKEVSKLLKEEEELIRKAEQKRKEEEAERLKEQRRLEEKAKAQEALERKKRMAEKAQARAKFKAEKEAEEKKKEKEKKAMKKGKKNFHSSEAADAEPTQVPESSSETTREPEVTEKPVTTAKKSHKPAALLYTKQVKTTKSIPAPPAPLRNRGKRRIPQWAWWLVLAIVAALIFPLGNIDIVGLLKPFISGSFK